MLTLYTTTTVAALLKCHVKTVEKLCRSGELPAVKKLRKWYILPDALVSYVSPQNSHQ